MDPEQIAEQEAREAEAEQQLALQQQQELEEEQRRYLQQMAAERRERIWFWATLIVGLLLAGMVYDAKVRAARASASGASD